ncbi:MAG: RagB/SusD family nutrient uptake outer membrane protein [Bacteroidales bacterium]|nr:RagB/SusD family nutrient uptake outer membrane protein [Bacteroidales bacterium]
MKINKYIISALVAVLCSACDSYLDKGPEENLSIEQTFTERAYVERWLYNIYSGMPLEMNFHRDSYRNPFVGGCDEMEVTTGTAACNLINTSSVSSVNDFGTWGQTAYFARRCNLFLEHIHLTPLEESEREEWKGEVHFMRAFYNFLALREYGPIPKYDKSLNIGADFKQIERASFDEIVEFIVDDCEKAIEVLPARREFNYYGRATAAAAYALRSRVLLYAASPLYNGNPAYTSLKSKSGKPLFSDYSKEKWTRAAEAAKECIDFCEGRLEGTTAEYALYESATNDPVKTAQELFMNNWNDEVLFAVNVGMNLLFEQSVDPVSSQGFSLYSPSQQMVDSYRMLNGEMPFETDENGNVTYDENGNPNVVSSSYTETGFAKSASASGWYPANISNMYVGREPRFYAHINYCGSQWKGKTLQMWSTGLDGIKTAGANHSKTGYLMKKFADEGAVTGSATPILSNRSWIFFRLGEIYLNYAEALNEAEDTPNADVYEYLNAIRKRGGIPELSGTYSQAQMRTLIRQERRVELAFETHRYFDVRRWKIAEKTENGPLYGMNINAGTSQVDPVYYKRTVVENRKFDERNYLFPINKDEIEKVPNIIQNPGY